MDKEKITDYLKETYSPEAILLIGSQMEGTAKPDSDWDIFLINPKIKVSEHVEWNNHTLDLTSKDWPEEGNPITTPIKPMHPNEVLFDGSNGRLNEVLQITQESYNKGPLHMYKDAVLGRYDKLSRWQHKVNKYADNPPVQFFYAGIFYEFAMRAWLELQNKWSLPPEQTLNEIRNTDPDLARKLIDFCTCESNKRVSLAEEVMGTLVKLRKEDRG